LLTAVYIVFDDFASRGVKIKLGISK